MQRTDRLFEIIHMLRRAKGPMTAEQIAERLEVSSRSVYRYMASLQAMRLPIEGEAGVGYILRPGYDLPPLNFDVVEQEALIIGMGLLTRTGDKELRLAAQRVLDKVETGTCPMSRLGVSDWGIAEHDLRHGAAIRAAIRDEHELEITYLSLDGQRSARRIWPLVLTYYVEVAVVSGWCHLRDGFRAFRADRIEDLRPTGAAFVNQGAKLREKMQDEGRL